MRSIVIAGMAAIAVTATAQTAEKPAELKRGAGRDKVVAHCNACHSLDYIPMNAGFLDVAGWDAEVAKMIKAYGAPLDQADAKAIGEYLGTNYGSRPQPSGPRAGEGSAARQGHEPPSIRPKAPSGPPPERTAVQRNPPMAPPWLAGAPRGSSAASRRHPEARGPLEALFAMLAEAFSCRPAKAEKHRAPAAACGVQPKRVSESGKREVRLR